MRRKRRGRYAGRAQPSFNTGSDRQPGRPATRSGSPSPTGSPRAASVNRGVVGVGHLSRAPAWLVLGQQHPEAFLDRPDGAHLTGRVGGVDQGREQAHCLPERCSAPVSSSPRFALYN